MNPIGRRYPEFLAEELIDALQQARLVIGDDFMDYLEIYRTNKRICRINSVKQGLTLRLHGGKAKNNHLKSQSKAAKTSNNLNKIKLIPVEFYETLCILDKTFTQLHLHDSDASKFISKNTLKKTNSLIRNSPKLIDARQQDLSDEVEQFKNLYEKSKKNHELKTYADFRNFICNKLGIGNTKYYKLKKISGLK